MSAKKLVKARYRVVVIVCRGMVGVGIHYRPDYDEHTYDYSADKETALQYARDLVGKPFHWEAPTSYLHPTDFFAQVMNAYVQDTEMEACIDRDFTHDCRHMGPHYHRAKDLRPMELRETDETPD